jgi:hypothetical protein
MAQKQTLFMETTEVPAERTAAEISSLLMQAGATQIATDCEGGWIVGLRWTMRIDGMELMFGMPARVKPLYELFAQRKGWGRPYGADGKPTDPQLWLKATRVGWRQLFRWTQAQVAMIDTGMVKVQEVFLPYWRPDGAKSLFEMMENSKFKALPEGKPQ